MPTLRIDRDDIHIEVTTIELSDTIAVICCRIVLDYHGLEVVLQDVTIVHNVEGLYSLIGPEN